MEEIVVKVLGESEVHQDQDHVDHWHEHVADFEDIEQEPKVLVDDAGKTVHNPKGKRQSMKGGQQLACAFTYQYLRTKIFASLLSLPLTILDDRKSG